MLRTLLFFLVALTIAVARPATAGEPTLALEGPARAAAWERVAVKVTVRNPGPRAILPLLVEVAGPAAPLGSWGLLGTSGLWAHRALGNRTPSGFDVLIDPHPPQRFDLARREPKTSLELVRIEPLPPGASTPPLSLDFDATYGQAGRLQARLIYVPLEAARLHPCVLERQPQERSLVPCRRISTLEQPGLGLYLPASELVGGRRTVRASVPFEVEHPAFDVDRARARAGLPDGPFAYDRRGRRWVLVDARARRTLVVGRSGEMLRLPGSWLEVLIALNTGDSTWLTWEAASGAEAQRLEAELRTAGLESRFFAFKGSRSTTRLELTLPRGDVATRSLARVIERHHGWLEDRAVRTPARP